MTAAVRDAGDAALLLEFEATIDPDVNARAVATAAALRAEAIPGIRDIVPTYRSVAVYFDPLKTDVDRVRHAAAHCASRAAPALTGRAIEIPVAYGGEDGPDLGVVAAFAGIAADEVIARHTATSYRVYMLGFLPGFAYMGSVDESIAMPRRAEPRGRVAAGSLGIAGRQTGVYPMESPGGWQIVGRSQVPVFDPESAVPALFAPGDTVRFVHDRSRDSGGVSRRMGSAPASAARSSRPANSGHSRRFITILAPGLLTTVQDEGRWGFQGSGVPVAGAMDRVAQRSANALVGNEGRAATLEATLMGPAVRLDSGAVVAIAGADLDATLDGATLPLLTPRAAPPGCVLRFGERRTGARASIAFGGGIDTAPVLGSRSTHALARVDGAAARPLVAGDRLALGEIQRGPRNPRVTPRVHSASGGARLRVLAGPQHEYFAPEAYDLLQSSRFFVTPQSNRMAYRLATANPIPRRAPIEMISDATFTGGIQVPASGQPILLMADRQTTGGYPQIATVITADLPIAAQVAPGDWLEFQLCSRAEALSALIAQEAQLLALE